MSSSSAPWIKLWWTWYTSRSHVGIGWQALAIGPVLMSMAKVSPAPDDEDGVRWCLDADGEPLDARAVAGVAQMAPKQAQIGIDKLVARKTLVRRADGAVGWPGFAAYQDGEAPRSARPQAEKPREEHAPWVYFIGEPDLRGTIRIGYSANPWARLKALRDETRRSDLEILAKVRGGREEEAQFHERFAHLRSGQREWFTPAPDLAATVAALRTTVVQRNDATVATTVAATTKRSEGRVQSYLPAAVATTEVGSARVAQLPPPLPDAEERLTNPELRSVGTLASAPPDATTAYTELRYAWGPRLATLPPEARERCPFFTPGSATLQGLQAALEQLGWARVLEVCEHAWDRAIAGELEPKFLATSFHGGGFGRRVEEMRGAKARAARVARVADDARTREAERPTGPAMTPEAIERLLAEQNASHLRPSPQPEDVQ